MHRSCLEALFVTALTQAQRGRQRSGWRRPGPVKASLVLFVGLVCGGLSPAFAQDPAAANAQAASAAAPSAQAELDAFVRRVVFDLATNAASADRIADDAETLTLRQLSQRDAALREAMAPHPPGSPEHTALSRERGDVDKA